MEQDARATCERAGEGDALRFSAGEAQGVALAARSHVARASAPRRAVLLHSTARFAASCSARRSRTTRHARHREAERFGALVLERWKGDPMNVLITGANGIRQPPRRAKRGHTIFSACRNEAKTRPVMEENGGRPARRCPAPEAAALDNLASVKKCAAEFNAKNIPLHVLRSQGRTGAREGRHESGLRDHLASITSPFALELERRSPRNLARELVVGRSREAHHHADRLLRRRRAPPRVGASPR